ncbi:MAG: hypothetical protein MRY59_00180 [Aquisalinus sp.]|nr:hypothetical protein [Aquisalinus sp.]
MGNSQRKDYLLSLVLVETSLPDGIGADLKPVLSNLAQAFQYWEIIIVISGIQASSQDLGEQFANLPNVRVLCVWDRAGYYRLRTLGASEAIGDVVIISTLQEALISDLAALADKSRDAGEPVVISLSKALDAFSPMRTSLSSLTGYKLLKSDTHTAAFPRHDLNRILEMPTADLDLRFERQDAMTPRKRIAASEHKNWPARKGHFLQRFALISDLIASSAPRALSAISLLSALVAVASLLYCAYAIIVYFSGIDVQDGWLTISLVLGLTSFFLSCALGALSLGLVAILDRLSGGRQQVILEEFSNTDFFRETNDLNIDLGTGAGQKTEPEAKS